jgi:hypothetical protein
MAKRLGTVLVFKPGVTKAEAEKALDKIASVIATDYYIAPKPPINEFNPDHGGPVWYVP